MNKKNMRYAEVIAIFISLIIIFSITIGYLVPKAFKERQEKLNTVKTVYKCNDKVYEQNTAKARNGVLVIMINHNTELHCNQYEVIHISK